MRMPRIECLVLLCLFLPATVNGQEHRWAADAALGYAGFVDDATKGYALVGGAIRRYVSAWVSVGPELVVMWNAGLLRDRALMLTGNVVVDLAADDSAEMPVIPFIIGGVGTFWRSDVVRGGPYWSSDPAFTAGGGIRIRMTRRIAAVAEYRIGWELHQRLSGALSARW